MRRGVALMISLAAMILAAFPAVVLGPALGLASALAERPIRVKWEPKYPSTPIPKVGNGIFKVRVASDPGALRISRYEKMLIDVTRASGQPVLDARISVAAKARDVERRMLTMPQLTKNLGSGRYLVEGLLFSMNGSWLLEFHISSGADRDKVLLEVVLK